MKTVFIVHRTDNWHSKGSFYLLGIATSLKKAIKLVKKQAKEENCKISKDDKFNLLNIKQTQNFENEGEFNIEEISLNELQ